METSRKMPDRQKGYDIEVTDLDDTVYEFVEVKTKKAGWDVRGVWLSRAQFVETGLDPARRFILAVVEYVYEPEATIYFVINPANRVDKFCFDYGWAQAADRRVSVRGALPGQTTDAGRSRDDDVGFLVDALMSTGLPEPDMPWQLNGLHLLAAWPDERIAIANDDADSDSEFDGWEIRRATEWTADKLIDALRGGR